ncbi:MAG TPA: branched-chain amino acid ABC transporter permease [Chloroflexia bacterium]|nr:branched-chain amino acid ABC transporter permease [Chloroflexia bacterium]
MDVLIQCLINGLSNASIYALIAFGFSLTFITTETLNFAQGEFVMLGSIVGIYLVMNWENDGALSGVQRPLWPLWVGYIVSVLVMSVLGVLLEKYVMRPFSAGLSIGWIMSTVAIAIIARNIIENFMGSDRMRLDPVVSGSVEITGQAIDWQKIFNIGLTLVVIVLLQLFFRRTMLGKSVKAVAFNPTAAGLMGINVNVVKALCFALCGALAAIGGLSLTPVIGGMGPQTGESLGIAAFAVAIIGGLDNLLGIAIAAVLYGITEQLIQNYISIDLYRALTFGLLIVVLAVKPTGIFGRTVVQKV